MKQNNANELLRKLSNSQVFEELEGITNIQMVSNIMYSHERDEHNKLTESQWRSILLR